MQPLTDHFDDLTRPIDAGVSSSSSSSSRVGGGVVLGPRLQDLLIKPCQRVPRYVLLLGELLKHSVPPGMAKAPLGNMTAGGAAGAAAGAAAAGATSGSSLSSSSSSSPSAPAEAPGGGHAGDSEEIRTYQGLRRAYESVSAIAQKCNQLVRQ